MLYVVALTTVSQLMFHLRCLKRLDHLQSYLVRMNTYEQCLSSTSMFLSLHPRLSLKSIHSRHSFQRIGYKILDGELRMAKTVEMKIAKEKIRFFYPKGLHWQASVPAAVK